MLPTSLTRDPVGVRQLHKRCGIVAVGAERADSGTAADADFIAVSQSWGDPEMVISIREAAARHRQFGVDSGS